MFTVWLYDDANSDVPAEDYAFKTLRAAKRFARFAVTTEECDKATVDDNGKIVAVYHFQEE